MKRLDHLVNRFKKRYALFSDEIKSVELYSNYEILIETELGIRMLYDDRDQTIDVVNGHQEESDWRRRFGRQLRSRMNWSGISQEELSKETGISITSLSMYMNGRTVPSIYNAKKIADALACSVDDLLRFPK